MDTYRQTGNKFILHKELFPLFFFILSPVSSFSFSSLSSFSISSLSSFSISSSFFHAFLLHHSSCHKTESQELKPYLCHVPSGVHWKVVPLIVPMVEMRIISGSMIVAPIFFVFFIFSP